MAIAKSSRQLTIASGKMLIAHRFATRLLILLRLQKPLDETRQSVVKPGSWLVAEQFSRLRNIRTSKGHIAGLLRQLVYFRLFPKRVFDRNDQVFELDRLALTKVNDIEEGAFVPERGHRTLNYVVDVSVIASRGAVAKLLDRLAGINTTSELMNCQVRPLSRTVHSEVTEGDDTELIKM